MKTPRFLPGLAALLLFPAALPAAELTGTIRSTDGTTTATVVLSSDLVPAVGEGVDIYFKIPGLDDDVSVAKAKVTGITADSVEVKVVEISGTITKDHFVRIHAANPVKRGAGVPAAPGVPMPRTVPPATPPAVPPATPPAAPDPGELPEFLLIRVDAQLVGMSQHPPEPPAIVPAPAAPTQPRAQWTAADHFSDGWTLHASGDFKGAVAAYTEAIKLDPAHSNALYSRARAALVLKQYDTVIADTTRVLELPGALSDTYSLRGSGYAGKGDLEKALADQNRAIELSPGNALAWSNRGDIYFRRKDYKRALEDTLYAAKIGNAYALPLYNLGFIYEAQGQKAEAAAAWQKAIKRDPAYAADLQPRLKALGIAQQP